MCSPLSSGIFVPATEACTGQEVEAMASWPMQIANISTKSAGYLINDCPARTRIHVEHISGLESGNITQVPRARPAVTHGGEGQDHKPGFAEGGTRPGAPDRRSGPPSARAFSASKLQCFASRPAHIRRFGSQISAGRNQALQPCFMRFDMFRKWEKSFRSGFKTLGGGR